MIELLHGDCLERLKELPDGSVDACVTDPPYGLSFMGKAWDYDVPGAEVWREVLRVLKPGGHLLAFAGTRTQHRMAVQIEDAGFEIRDLIAWVYGSGFPKNLDVSKAIDKAAGAKREVVGRGKKNGGASNGKNSASVGYVCETNEYDITAPAPPAAQQWAGWGTALKPALEPITVARKPLGGTVAENVLRHGTGALNVDGCRVGDSTGRWPANLIHDGSEEVVGLFPQSEGMKRGTLRRGATTGLAMGAHGIYGEMQPMEVQAGYGDSGSAARFFYCAKASKRDRDEGLDEFAERPRRAYSGPVTSDPRMDHEQRRLPSRNHHPTVKPTDLMRYLCRLVTPPGGVVLDPFMGSGSTGKAAVLEGFRFIGIEREAEYLEIARGRIQLPEQGSLL